MWRVLMVTSVVHSIIVPVYNALENVTFCLNSIESSIDLNENASVELIIIDDKSDEDTQKFLQYVTNKNKNISLYRHEENLGYLLSVNEAIGYARGSIITLLNSDTTIPQDFIARIRACFDSRKEIGIASPILANGNPFSIKMYEGLAPFDVDQMDCRVKNITPEYPTIIFPDGACFSISRACINAVGLFDTAYDMGYFEELDYCMQANKAGFDTVYIDNMYVFHQAHASFGKEEKRKHMIKNRIFFHEKWGKEYDKLHALYPKKKHKKRVYLNFYSQSEYFLRETLLLLSKFIPFSFIRRTIRAKYQ